MRVHGKSVLVVVMRSECVRCVCVCVFGGYVWSVRVCAVCGVYECTKCVSKVCDLEWFEEYIFKVKAAIQYEGLR